MPVVGQRFVIIVGRCKRGALIEDLSLEDQGWVADRHIAIEGVANNVSEWKERQIVCINRYGGWSSDLDVICERFKLIADLRDK